jgi:RND family efflux transporter MFP subunit
MQQRDRVLWRALGARVGGLAALAALVGTGTAGCGSHEAQAQGSGAASGPKTVGFVIPARGDVERTLTQPGNLQGIEETVLYARATGYLRSLSVDKGDRVSAGQVLGEIESPELAHQQEQARASARQAQAGTEGARALRGRANADVEQARAAEERSAADRRQAEASVAQANAEVRRAEAGVPRLRARVDEEDASVALTQAQRQQSELETQRAEQQARTAEARVAQARSIQARAEAEARQLELTHARLKSVQDRDAGLVAAQDVDTARTRVEAARRDVEAAAAGVEAARSEAEAARSAVEAARRGVQAADQRNAQARSRLVAARAEVETASRDVDVARAREQVASAQAASSARQVEVTVRQRRALEAQSRVAGAQLRAAEHQEESGRSAYRAAAALEGYTRLLAPFSGVVIERMVDPGALLQGAGATAATARGILKLARDDSLRVLCPVPESAVRFVRKGGRAVLALDAFPKEKLIGSIARFAPAVDPKSRTMLVEVDLPNPKRRFRPGMYARVTLVLERHADALSIPGEAIMGKDDDRFVYLISGATGQRQTIRKQKVKVGVDDGKQAEVTEGLSHDSRVVLTGRDTVVDGAEVRAEPAKVEAHRK